MVISATQVPIIMGRSMVTGLAGIPMARRNTKVSTKKANRPVNGLIIIKMEKRRRKKSILAVMKNAKMNTFQIPVIGKGKL